MNGTKSRLDTDHWRLRVYTGKRRPLTNTPIMVSKNFRGSASDADAELRRFVEDVERGHRKAQERTVASLLNRWYDHVTADSSAYYLREARRRIDTRLVPAFGKTRIDKLEVDVIDAQYRKWVTEGLSPSTVRGFHAILAAAYRQAERWGYVEVNHNPLRKVKAPSVPKARTHAPSVAELRALLLASVDDPVLAAAVALGAVTGARRGELCALRWSDVDLAGRQLSVARALTVIKRSTVEGPTKTHQVRDLALDDAGVAVLKLRRAAQERLAEANGRPLVADPFVLSRRADGSRPCLPDGLTHGFTAACIAAGLVKDDKPRFHFHELRHFAGTHAISAGHDILSVAGRLGHADATTTIRVYGHAVPARDIEVASTLGRALALEAPAINPEPGSFS